MTLRLPALSLLLAAVACVLAPARAQQLRHGVANATLVVTARSDGVTPLGDDLLVYRFTTVDTLKGEPVERFSVLVRKQVADQPKPAPTDVHVMCLRPEPKPDLPARFAPWFRMTGFAGDNPVVDDSPESKWRITLIKTLLESETGADPGKIAHELVGIVQHGTGTARIEATEVLRERPVLRDAVSAIERDALMSRAVAETDDVPLKIALASLCAESGIENVVQSLAISLDEVGDPRFCQALGRIAKHVHGEEATQVLKPMIANARGVRRDRLLLVLGATRTESGLQVLLKMHSNATSDPAIRAALQATGDKRALDALQQER